MMRRLLLCMPYVGPMAFEFLSLVAPIKLAVRLSTMSFGAIMTSCLRTTLRKDADSWRVSGEVRSVSIIVPLSCQDCSQRSPTTAFHVIQVHEGLLYIRMGMRIRDALTNNVALVKQYVKQETGRQNSRSTGKAINKVLSEISKKLTHVNDDKIQPSSLACFMSWAKHLDHQGKLADRLTAEAPKFFRDVMNPELGELHRPEQQRATALPSEPPADLNAPYWTALATWCFLTIPIPDPFLAIPPAAEDIDVGHDTQADANDGAPAADAPQGAAATEVPFTCRSTGSNTMAQQVPT